MIIQEHGSKRGRHLKILVEIYLNKIDLNKPLLRDKKLKLGHQEVWVEFPYQQITTFCSYCGKVGHSERHCHERNQDSKVSCLQGGQYGEWLKAEVNRSGAKPFSERPQDKLQSNLSENINKVYRDDKCASIDNPEHKGTPGRKVDKSLDLSGISGENSQVKTSRNTAKQYLNEWEVLLAIDLTDCAAAPECRTEVVQVTTGSITIQNGNLSYQKA